MKKLFAVALALPAVLAACTKAPEPVADIRPVRVMQVKAGDTGSLTAFAGEIRARVESDQSFRIGGKLTERKAELGAQVKRGDVLARLDPQDANLNAAAANASVKQAESELEFAKAELDRTKDLFEKKFVSQGVLDQKVNGFKAASARRDSVRAQASVAGNQAGYATLLADADGVVTAVNAEPGQVVAAGQPVVRVARLGEKDAVINVAEHQVAQIKAASNVHLATWANPEKKYTGRVRDVAAAADPQTRTYQVKVEVTNADEALRWGMSASVAFIDAQANAAAGGKTFQLPLTALSQKADGQAQVWVVGADNKVQARAVTVAKYGEQGASITSGLNGGETIVTAGVHKLVAGQVVKPLGETVAASPSTTAVVAVAAPVKAN